MIYIENADIYTPDHLIERGAVIVDRGRIAAVGPAAAVPRPEGARVIDASRTAARARVPGAAVQRRVRR